MKHELKNIDGIQHFQTGFQTLAKEKARGEKSKEAGDADAILIKGYASTPTVDRYNDVVEPEAFRETIQNNYRKNPIVLYQHDPDRPVGKVTFMSIDSRGLYIEALIYEKDVATKISQGILRTFSIGYIPEKWKFMDKDGNELDMANSEDRRRVWESGTKRILTKVELVENSIVSVPANPDALFSMAKSVKSFFNSLTSKTMKDVITRDPENLLDTKEEEAADVDSGAADSESAEVESNADEAAAETHSDETGGGEEGAETDTDGEAEEGDAEADAEEEEGSEEEAEEAAEEDDEEVEEEESEESEDDSSEDGEAEDEAEEEVAEEKSESGDEADEEEAEAEEDSGEKSVKIDPKLVTAENLSLALKTVREYKQIISGLNKKVADLEAELKRLPVKQALVYGVNRHLDDKKDVPEGKKNPDQKKGLKEALLKAAQ